MKLDPDHPQIRSPEEPDGGLLPYAGRWIAMLGERIVGQGGTPTQALQSAKAARHKETPQII